MKAVLMCFLPMALALTTYTEKDNCERRCGNMIEPYPFGLNKSCAWSSDHVLFCNHISGNLSLGKKNPVFNISLESGTMTIGVDRALDCYDENGRPLNSTSRSPWVTLGEDRHYTLSDIRNKFTVFGCDTLGLIRDAPETFWRGCFSYCGHDVNFTAESTCSGPGCCQTSIPKSLRSFNISMSSAMNYASVYNFSSCGSAFLVDQDSFNVSDYKLPVPHDMRVKKYSNVVLDWVVERDLTCKYAQSNRSKYACGANSICYDFKKGKGYRCFCEVGYTGNPYASQLSPGCQVIALPIFSITAIALVFDNWRRRRKQKNFKRNGGELLKHHRVQIFTEAELAKATNNYDDSNKLGEGGFGSVYRGRIAGDTMIAVKKPKDVHKSIIKGDFQHELETVMQINHKNVVKLHGICLETRIPLLVYEYISNGTLFQHIHQNASTILRLWKNRLRIAAEAALALEYMHSCAEPPIIHGDIKSANILLDHNYLAKVSDFGTSILISPEHSNIVATEIQGTLGYIDLEYLTTGMLTIKSDVYSFGVVLMELLTRKKPTSFITKFGESINIIHYFISSVKDKTLSDVINFEDASREEMERVGMVAEIAVKCLDQSSAKRLAMREVAEQLARINHELDSLTVEENIEETKCEVDEENLPSHSTSITCVTSQHGTSSSLF
ncbi:putative wall-associated receptor kinase-like 16 [Eucalyptus grandis]|uniref:putative wall-associated receptor kinase-like 16 n=1 Tax=Eucalyptus grandis TaxID=71139 RepID=UPI00192E9BD6|nr:putative wall-associated receptor kinase-like 16 [Eucalyptus grandis]